MIPKKNKPTNVGDADLNENINDFNSSNFSKGNNQLSGILEDVDALGAKDVTGFPIPHRDDNSEEDIDLFKYK